MVSFVLCLALLGHGFLFAASVNRLHATNLPRETCNLLTWVLFAFALAIPTRLG